MAPARRRRRQSSLLGLFLLALFGVATMAGGAGYVVGMGQRDLQAFTPQQQEYLIGLVAGTSLHDSQPTMALDQLRATCAGRFYPSRPLAMAGCVAGLSDPPPGGYKLPPS